MAVTLTADRAERLLRQWTQASTAPGLTTAEIEDLLWSARIADASANDPDAVLWTPTYGVSDLRQAAADGWMLKAGKLTTEYDVAVGSGTDFKRKQQYEMCLSMAAQFGGGSGSSVGGGGIGSIPLTTEGFVGV